MAIGSISIIPGEKGIRSIYSSTFSDKGRAASVYGSFEQYLNCHFRHKDGFLVKPFFRFPTFDGDIKEIPRPIYIFSIYTVNIYVLCLKKSEPHPGTLHREERGCKFRYTVKLLSQLLSKISKFFLFDGTAVIVLSRNKNIVPCSMLYLLCSSSDERLSIYLLCFCFSHAI